jgi:hypothetical protein
MRQDAGNDRRAAWPVPKAHSVAVAAGPSMPGWYPDPSYRRIERWWNGHTWTRAERPREADTPRGGHRAGSGARLALSTDAKRAVIITVAAAAAFALWGYTAADAAPVSDSRSVSAPSTDGHMPAAPGTAADLPSVPE